MCNMHNMHRAQVLIENWQYEALKAKAAKDGRSISELLREILTQHLGGETGVERPGLADIEGLANDPGASGREHDDFLYGNNSLS